MTLPSVMSAVLTHPGVVALATGVPPSETSGGGTGTFGGVDLVGPIAGTGLVGIFLLCVILRFKIMPTYVFDDAKAEWERQRTALESDIADLKQAVKDGNAVYTQQVIPTLTRVLDAERELVDLRREEVATRRRRAT